MKKIAMFMASLAFLAAVAACSQELSVSGISPAVGAVGGGDPVEIIGTGFDPNMGVTVYFGNMKVDNVAVKGPDRLMVGIPSQTSPQVVDVRVMTDDGRELVLRKAFRYIEKTNLDIRDLGARRSQRETPPPATN